MPKLLTVIVPSYNMEKFLPKCLGSLVILDQSIFEQLEVLVINDGSRDKTSEIAHDFERRYPTVFRVIDKINGHYGSCVNCGLAEAKGEFVKILDADDWFDADVFPSYMKYLASVTSADLVVSDYVNVDATGQVLERVGFDFTEDKQINIDEYVKRRRYDQMHMMAYKTSLLRDMGYKQLEGISYTDTEWTFLPFVRVSAIRYFSKALYVRLLGREGQSVDPTVLERDHWMFGKLALHMAIKYQKIFQFAKPSVDSVLSQRLAQMIVNVYKSELLSRGKSRKFDLRQFDSELNSSAPKLAELADDAKLFGIFGCSLINLWRRNSSSIGIMIALYKLKQITLMGRNWIKRKVTRR